MTAIPLSVTPPIDRITVLEHDTKNRSHLEVLATIDGVLVEVECREIKYHKEADVRAILTYQNGTKETFHFPHHFYTRDQAHQSPLWQATPHMQAIEKAITDYLRKRTD